MATATVTPAPTRSRPASGRRLPRRWRQVTLIVHVLSAGIWVGVDVIVAVLVLTGRLADSAGTRALAGEALATFVVLPMLTTGVVCLVSGIVLGIGTKWGLVRYRWVFVKLVVNVVLCLAIVFALAPGMDTLAAEPATMPTDMLFPPVVSLIALSFATTLAVMKPSLGGPRLRTQPAARRSPERDAQQS